MNLVLKNVNWLKFELSSLIKVPLQRFLLWLSVHRCQQTSPRLINFLSDRTQVSSSLNSPFTVKNADPGEKVDHIASGVFVNGEVIKAQPDTYI